MHHILLFIHLFCEGARFMFRKDSPGCRGEGLGLGKEVLSRSLSEKGWRRTKGSGRGDRARRRPRSWGLLESLALWQQRGAGAGRDWPCGVLSMGGPATPNSSPIEATGLLASLHLPVVLESRQHPGFSAPPWMVSGPHLTRVLSGKTPALPRASLWAAKSAFSSQ